MSRSDPAFRVIVVGAGVAGLTASHCLQKAGIDHILLERRPEVAPPEGASIAIYPHGARILQQIGCLESAKRASVPCNRWYCRRPNGRAIMDNGFFKYCRENHGEDVILLERRRFLQILYDHLPDKEFVRLNASVACIKQEVSGVEVVLKDGHVERGSIVVGCDGVNSMTRSLMWDSANRVQPGLITVEEKTSMKTRWKCLIGVGPGAPELGDSDMTVTHDERYSFLTLTQPEAVFFFVFVRLDEPFSWPHRVRYTDADAEELAARLASHVVAPTIVFGEIWKRRHRGQLISIEEGVLEHWHHGRIVLAGDSVHKITPNIALGGNSSMESIVVLCNHIQRMMVRQHGTSPSRATLRETFAAYQQERKPRMQHIMKYSGLITDVQAWRTPLHRFLAEWVLPLQADRKIADQLGEVIRAAPKLDYVDLDEYPAGLLSWKDDEKNDHRLVSQRSEGKLAPRTLLAGNLKYCEGRRAALMLLCGMLIAIYALGT